VSVFGLFRRPRPVHEAEEPRGFTMVEVLTVVVVMGTLVRMAVPSFHEVLVRARAAEVIGDFETVRVAVLNYHADHLQWPPDGYAGQVPGALAPYLPDGFSFQGMGYQLDWENWVLPAGLPQDPEARGILAVSVVTEDRELGEALSDLLGGAMAHYALGDAYTFVIERQ
jgi:prepilin-type N-terminal cleavage/methylation domain-containing protein